jgi:RNA polymerase-binding transcription factor DksA
MWDASRSRSFRVPRKLRTRLEEERRDAVGKLQQRLASSGLIDVDLRGITDSVSEGDQAQACLLQHLEVAAAERLGERIARLSEALQRLDIGAYGTCGRCGHRIGSRRLQALPEATTCLGCQEQLERAAVRMAVVAARGDNGGHVATPAALPAAPLRRMGASANHLVLAR